MKHFLILILLLGLCVPFAGADVFLAEVEQVEVSGQSLLVHPKDAKGNRSSEERQILLSKDTKYQNFASAGELREGDEIKVKASRDKHTGKWVGKKLEINKIKIRN